MERQILEVCLITLAATIAAFVAARLLRIDRVLVRLVRCTAPIPSPQAAVSELIRLAETARTEGVSSIALGVKHSHWDFLARGLAMLTQPIDPAAMRSAMHGQLDAVLSRRPGRWVPALAHATSLLGLGALSGALVLLLTHVEDPTTISAGVAISILCLLVAGGLFHQLSRPLADAVRAPYAQELLVGLIVIEGLLAIRDGADPGMVRERIAAVLPPDAALSPDLRAAA